MIRNFVLESANAPGTNLNVILAGAKTGRVTFRSVYADAAQCFYFIDDGLQAEWGVGAVHYGTPNTLSRDTVVSNTAGTTNRLNFSSAVDVYNEIIAERMPYIQGGVVYAPNARLDSRSGGVPVGAGMDHWGSGLPAGWLWANGAAVSRTTYALLFSVLSTAYGAGDGSSTFNLPNKGGRVSVGRETMGGVASTNVISTVPYGGTGLGTWIGDQNLQQHQHTITDQAHNHVLKDPGHYHNYRHVWTISGATLQAGAGYSLGDSWYGTDDDALYRANISMDSSYSNINHTEVFGGGGAQNIQPGITCNYIIYAGYV